MHALVLLIGLMIGCNTGEPPLMQGVHGVAVTKLTPAGLQRFDFDDKERQSVIDCMVGGTSRIGSEAEMSPPLLSNAILIEVADVNGRKSFELLTKTNMKTRFQGEERYYYNGCIYDLVKGDPAERKRKKKRKSGRRRN